MGLGSHKGHHGPLRALGSKGVHSSRRRRSRAELLRACGRDSLRPPQIQGPPQPLVSPRAPVLQTPESKWKPHTFGGAGGLPPSRPPGPGRDPQALVAV